MSDPGPCNCDQALDLIELGQALYDMLCNEAGMPESYQQTDSRMAAWRKAVAHAKGEDAEDEG